MTGPAIRTRRRWRWPDGYGQVASVPGWARSAAVIVLLLAGGECLLAARRAVPTSYGLFRLGGGCVDLAEGGVQAGREHHRGQPERDRGQRDRRAGGAGERGGQADRHRPGQGQLPASRCTAYPRPARGACPAAIAPPPTAARLAAPATSAASPVSASMPSGDREVDPQRDGHGVERPPPFSIGSTHQLPRTVPAIAPASAGHADLGQVGGGDLGRGEADALEHADPPVPGRLPRH